MDIKDILSRCDHTLLKQEATWEQVKELCDDAVRYETASVCIIPRFQRADMDDHVDLVRSVPDCVHGLKGL